MYQCAGCSVVLWLAMATLSFSATAQNWSVTSPNGQVRLSVQLADLGGTADYPRMQSRLYYRVEHGAEGEPGGGGQRLAAGPATATERISWTACASSRHSRRSSIEETYEMPHGKRRQCHNRANHLTLVFRNARRGRTDRTRPARLRRRRGLPLSAAGQRRRAAGAEGARRPASRCRRTPGSGARPATRPRTYSPAYETYYENGIARRHARVAGRGLGVSAALPHRGFAALGADHRGERRPELLRHASGQHRARTASIASRCPIRPRATGTAPCKPVVHAAVDDALARDRRRQFAGEHRGIDPGARRLRRRRD